MLWFVGCLCLVIRLVCWGSGWKLVLYFGVVCCYCSVDLLWCLEVR